MSERIEDLRASVLAMITRGADQPRDDAEFTALAQRLFAYQFAQNLPYRRFCERRGRTPDRVTHWQQIPPVPIAAFKELTLACGPVEQAVACFTTSGTTRPEQRGKHFHFTLDVYDASATTFFQATILPDAPRLRLAILGCPPQDAPHSSLAHYLGLMHDRFGTAGSRYYVGPSGLDLPALARDLREAAMRGEAVAVLGASFAFVHALDGLRAGNGPVVLPPGSRVMDTGGFKGRSREVGQAELYAEIAAALGVPESHCANMYGMTELSMQCYDSPFRRRSLGQREDRVLEAPPWARTLILDPDTLEPATPGTRGIICHYDLANCSSVIGILTEDVGVATETGFRLLGRVAGTEARGCSVAVDEMLDREGRR